MQDVSWLERDFGSLEAWRTGPDFWVSIPERGQRFIAGLQGAVKRCVGHSAGGREIIALEYGEKEELEVQTDNLQSAMASHFVPPDPTAIYPEAFYGTHRRSKPVVVLQGAIHGDELTGTVASFNLCHVLETGKDLRGKAWPELQELARGVRLCIIPWLNMDGSTRTPLVHYSGLPAAVGEVLTQGVAKDGTRLHWPASKRVFPIPVAKMAFLGTYFNDAGVNLQYDFCQVERQPETTAWQRYYLAERPDAVVIWHCNAGSLIGPPSYFVPPAYQLAETRLAGAVRGRLQREGYGHPVAGRLSWVELPGLGKPYIEQIAAVYHTCGALPILCELPSGCREWFCSCEEMLDIGLLVLEEILRYGHRDGFRPFEFREKLLKQGALAEPANQEPSTRGSV